MTTEPLNLRKRAGYDIWYLTWNDPRTGQGFWLRYVIEHSAPPFGASREGALARDSCHAELWFARFDPRDPARTFGVHRRFAGEPDGGDALPFQLTLGGAELRHDGARGQLAANGHDIRWDLAWTPAARELRLYPDLMYRGRGFGSHMVVSPNPRVALRGELVIDGERIDVAGAPLGQSHVWGTKHALTWTWGRCAELAGAGGDALLELTAGRLQRAGFTLPPLLSLVLELPGETLRLGQIRHALRNRATWELGRVRVAARGAFVRVTGELTCRADQLIEAPYVDPDGTKLWCANTEIGDARVVIERRTLRGWREDRVLTARGTAHFEIGRRERDPRVQATHALVEQ